MITLFSHSNSKFTSEWSLLVIILFCSHFPQLQFLQLRTLTPLTHLSDLPVVDACFVQLSHQVLLLVLRDADQQSSACLCRQALHQFEVLHFLLHFNQIPIHRESVDDEIDIILLCLGEIVGMSKYSEACYVSASTSSIFGDQASSHNAQCCHLLLCPIESFKYFALCRIDQYFLSFLFICFEPLHCVDGQARAQRFSENYRIPWLSVVRHYELIFFDHCYGASSHHRPRIVDCLSSSHLATCLLSCISKTLNHERSGHVFFYLAHICRHSQNHEYFFDVANAHRIEIRNSVAESNAAEHIRRLNKRVEEVDSRDESISIHLDG